MVCARASSCITPECNGRQSSSSSCTQPLTCIESRSRGSSLLMTGAFKGMHGVHTITCVFVGSPLPQSPLPDKFKIATNPKQNPEPHQCRVAEGKGRNVSNSKWRPVPPHVVQILDALVSGVVFGLCSNVRTVTRKSPGSPHLCGLVPFPGMLHAGFTHSLVFRVCHQTFHLGGIV